MTWTGFENRFSFRIETGLIFIVVLMDLPACSGINTGGFEQSLLKSYGSEIIVLIFNTLMPNLIINMFTGVDPVKNKVLLGTHSQNST